MNKTYFIHTFGCQSNKSDSERIAGDYQARGYTKAKSWKECDELIVNTCAIRQRAEHRAQGFIHNVVTFYKEKNKPRPKIILTGCMLHHGKNKVMDMIPAIDEVLPVNEVGFNQAAVRKDKNHAWIPISAVATLSALTASCPTHGVESNPGKWKRSLKKLKTW